MWNRNTTLQKVQKGSAKKEKMEGKVKILEQALKKQPLTAVKIFKRNE